MAAGIQTALVVQIDVTADATGAGAPTYVLPRSGTIIDVQVICTATNGSGTLTLQRQALSTGSYNAVTAALTCDTDNAIARASSLVDPAQTECAATDRLKVVANGAADRGRVYITYLPAVAA